MHYLQARSKQNSMRRRWNLYKTRRVGDAVEVAWELGWVAEGVASVVAAVGAELRGREKAKSYSHLEGRSWETASEQ